MVSSVIGAVFMEFTCFRADGTTTESIPPAYLPLYLDWQPMRLKAFWFKERGFGPPEATHVLLRSQGEQLLVTIDQPLRQMKHLELKEIDNGLESKVDEHARENGYSRTPRNQ